MNQEHYEILIQGVEVWNEWREENPKIKPDLKKAHLRTIDLGGTIYHDGIALGEEYHFGLHLSKDFVNIDTGFLNCKFSLINLTGADLSGANLRMANLRMADLSGANLTRADLSNANLTMANLSSAKIYRAIFLAVDLSSANLNWANIFKADFSDSDLSGADLSGADLRIVNVSSANFKNTIINQTSFSIIDLSNCKHLGKAHHGGPSTIDISTLEYSKGKVPSTFLEGIGFNRWQILFSKLNDPNLTHNQITDLVYEIDHARNSSPIQLFNIFISYNHADNHAAELFERTMKLKDIRCWRDVHDMVSGPIEKQIDKAIRINETVLLILSKNSVNSDWVEWEMEKARKLEKELNRHVICPIALDDSWKTCSWSGVLRNQIEKYNILDFSNWKDEAFFNRQFEKLLKGLNVYYRGEE